jgi:hypothetical protein
MNLTDFNFPVIERRVAVHNGEADLIDLGNTKTFLPGDYKAIVREDSNELISIVRDSYQIVPNESIINQLMEELDKSSTTYLIEPSHSFVENNRMRLQVKFPKILINDGRSDIALSLYLHNSYDMSEGIRMFWGAIRGICTNGMVFGKVLGTIYRRHTSGFQMDNLHNELSRMSDLMPRIQNRIADLDSHPITPMMKEEVEKELGKRVATQIFQTEYESQWKLYNAITYMVSHVIQQRYRARYQMATSRIFGL